MGARARDRHDLAQRGLRALRDDRGARGRHASGRERGATEEEVAIPDSPHKPYIAKGVPRSLRAPKGAEVYVRSENPRGELAFYMVSDGGTAPYRCKIRGGAFCNIAALPYVSRGYLIADLVAIIGSIDIVLGEVDR